ncbi:MAG: DUF1836 domain-containing protein [Eubacterium sp.]|jgi:DNA-binding transcriptional MerR regulator|nr:DUF1836 domain-containing protein [Eubacterium sp.]
MERKNQEKKMDPKIEREKEQELKKEIRDKLMLDFIVPEDIPNEEMFMEQVTTFMEKHLKANLRNEEEKTLTKAMINNYTKNKLMPPPVKKRYSREHLIFLIYIYYMKNVMSISDIQKMMEPLMSDDMTDEKLYEIYKKTFEMEKAEYFNIEDSVIEASRITEKRLPKSEDERLNKMLYIFMLGYDVYSKKRLIEKLIDELD